MHGEMTHAPPQKGVPPEALITFFNNGKEVEYQQERGGALPPVVLFRDEYIEVLGLLPKSNRKIQEPVAWVVRFITPRILDPNIPILKEVFYLGAFFRLPNKKLNGRYPWVMYDSKNIRVIKWGESKSDPNPDIFVFLKRPSMDDRRGDVRFASISSRQLHHPGARKAMQKRANENRVFGKGED